jgi:hypothetical protein
MSSKLSGGTIPILPYRHKRPPQRFLDLFYKRPNPNRSFEDLHRFQHDDLAGFSDRDLLMERDQVWLRLILERPAEDDWLWERHARLIAEQEHRRRSLTTLASDHAQKPSEEKSIIVRRNGKEVAA